MRKIGDYAVLTGHKGTPLLPDCPGNLPLCPLKSASPEPGDETEFGWMRFPIGTGVKRMGGWVAIRSGLRIWLDLLTSMYYSYK